MIANNLMMMKTGIPNNEDLKIITIPIIEAGTRKLKGTPPKPILKNPRKKVVPEAKKVTRRIMVKTNSVPKDRQDRITVPIHLPPGSRINSMRITIAAIHNAMIINARMKGMAISAVKAIPVMATAHPMTIANGLTIGEMKDEITIGEIMKGEIVMIGGRTKTIATPHQTDEVSRMTHIIKI